MRASNSVYDHLKLVKEFAFSLSPRPVDALPIVSRWFSHTTTSHDIMRSWPYDDYDHLKSLYSNMTTLVVKEFVVGLSLWSIEHYATY